MNRTIYKNLFRRFIHLAIAGMLGFTSHAYGQTDADTTRQKLDLANSFLNSSSAKQIRDTGSIDSRRLLTKAEKIYVNARKALAKKDFERASKLAGEVLKMYTAANRTRVNRKKSVADYARENKSLETEIDAYLRGFRAALKEKGSSMTARLDQRSVADLMARAAKLRTVGNEQEAGKLLRRAQRMVAAALTKIRGNETVVYTLELHTPADEYRYERARYDEYLRLAKHVISSVKIAKVRTKMFENMMEEGKQLNSRAEDLAGKGNYEAATSRMENALAKLVQGLQLLGIPVSSTGK